MLRSLIEMFNRGDVEAFQRWLDDHYADPYADKDPQDDRAVWNSMDYTTALLDALRFDHACGLTVYQVEVDLPYETAVIAQLGLAGEWVYLKLKLAPEAPHAVIELRTRPALLPPQIGEGVPTSHEEVIRGLHRFVGRLAEADIFAGAVLIAKDGLPVFQRAYGLASREFNAPNRIDTKFNIGSLNKMFTAVAIAQLAEEGALLYSDTIADHLPGYPREDAAHATIDQLLCHMSGIGSYWNDQFECERARIRTVSDFLRLFATDLPYYPPGKRWFYSNGGFVILGAILETITGQDYYDIVRERIYQPSGMTGTDAYEMDRSVPNLAIGYTHVTPDGLRELGPHRNNLFMHVIKGGPGGGGFSTVEDLLRFGTALHTNTILSAASVQTLLAPKVALRGEGLQYGYGFFVRQINGQRVVGHSGNFPGIGAQFDMYLDAGYTAVILSNVDPSASQIVADYLRDRFTRLAA